MTAVDSSVVVAGFATWHVLHRSASQVLDGCPAIPAHALLESYSVLTRLPAPHRAEPGVVTDFLDSRFPADPLTLDGNTFREFVLGLGAASLAGGVVYDALIGYTTMQAGHVLATCDVRAATTYERLGCSVSYLG